MSIKLSAAVAQQRIVVKNVISGEVCVILKGQSFTIPPRGELDLSKEVGKVTMQDVGHVKTSLQRGMLRLV